MRMAPTWLRASRPSLAVSLAALALAAAAPARADVHLAYTTDVAGATLWVDGHDADELFTQLPATAKPEYECLRYDSVVVGGDGTPEYYCVQYSTKVVKETKALLDINCEQDLVAGTSQCSFPQLPHGSGLFATPRVPYGGDSNALGKVVTSPLATSDGALRLECTTLVAGRYFDCFTVIDYASPAFKVALDSSGSFIGPLRTSGKRLVDGHLWLYRTPDYHPAEFASTVTLVNALADHPSDPVNSDVALTGTILNDGTAAEIYLHHVVGAATFTNVNDLITLTATLDPAYVAALVATVKPGQRGVLASGATIFGVPLVIGSKEIATVTFAPDLSTAQLVYSFPDRL